MFAGPNGSGKSTLIKNLKEKISFGVYINADEIEEDIKRNHFVDLDKYTLKLTNDHWLAYLREQPSILSKIPNNEVSDIKINQNILVGFPVNQLSYIAASIADFLREMLFLAKKSFTFETVMSHSSKIEFINRLKSNGYRTYLYYVATESSDINLGRITARVKKGGHPVDPDKVKKRYAKSLNLLYQAIKATDRAYIFDNSGRETKFIAEITSGNKVILKVDSYPYWFNEFVLNRSH
jgi:predicted ABC-type ATPase